MKKKIFGALIVVAITAGAMINVNLNKVSNKADLALANVEALAKGEGGSTSCEVSTNCYGDVWHPDKVTGTVSCSGTNCSRTDTSVTCDGATTSC